MSHITPPRSRLPEPRLPLDHEPIRVRISITNNIEEEKTMTVRELALNLIEHADETPEPIDLTRAAELIGWLDPDSGLPEDLTPESFMEAWNDIIRNSPVEDLWSPI